MMIDGKAIAQAILANVQAEIERLNTSPHLTVFTCAPNFETKKFLALKQKRAKEVGVVIEVISLDPTLSTNEVISVITDMLPQTDGVVVQLPFPKTMDISHILQVVPRSHDVDALLYQGEKTEILPPVIGAIDAIAQKHGVVWQDKQVVVVGKGRLVGAPAALYAQTAGATVRVVEKHTLNNDRVIKEADILILGAGVPSLIDATMVKEGVQIFDAGTSEEGGMLVGDAAENVIEKAGLVTPVPGGIGPITIAILLKNVLRLMILHSKK